MPQRLGLVAAAQAAVGSISAGRRCASWAGDGRVGVGAWVGIGEGGGKGAGSCGDGALGIWK